MHQGCQRISSRITTENKGATERHRWARLGRAVKQDAGGNAQQFDLHFKTSWISRKVSNKYDGLIM